MDVLTQPAKGKSHRKTAITIDWHNVTVDDLFSLARNALVADAMARMQKAEEFPDTLRVVAKEHVHRPSAAVEKYSYIPPKLKLDKELERFLGGLSPSELKALSEMNL